MTAVNLRAALLPLAVFVAGCSSESSPASAAAPPVPEEPTVSVSFCLKEFFSGAAWTAARVAVVGREDIAPQYTDELGCATLRGVPAQSRVLLSFTAPGLTPTLLTLVTGTSDVAGLRFDSPGAEWRQATEVTFHFGLDYAKSVFSFRITSNSEPTVTSEGGVPGVKPHLNVPFDGGPYFNEGATAWAPADTPATTESGIGAFFNVEPGEAELELELPPGIECATGYDEVWSLGLSWPAAGTPAPGRLRLAMPLRAGFHGAVAMRCFR